VSIGAAVDGQQNLRKKKAPDNNALPGGGAGTQGGQSPDIPQVLRNSQKQKKQAGGLPAQSGGGQLRAPVDNGGQDQNFVQPQLNATPKKNNIQRYESGNQSRDLGQPQSNGKPKKHSDGQQLENGGQNQNYFGQPQLDAKPKKNNIQRYESGNQNRDFGRPPSNGQPKKHRDGQQLENGGQNQDFVQPQGNTKRNRQQPQFERQQQEQGQPSRKKGSQTCGGANQPPCN
jgi:hypothetical protein